MRLHPSITIESADGFRTGHAGVSGGSGTAADPYVIRDLVIVQTLAWGIRIANTQDHVRIENVTIQGYGRLTPLLTDCVATGFSGCNGTRGVDVERASNVTLDRVLVQDESYMVRIVDAHDVTISNSALLSVVDATGGSFMGVRILRSTDVGVVENRIEAEIDWWISDSSKVAVVNNSFVGRGVGAMLGGSEEVRILDNVFEDKRIVASIENADLELHGNWFAGPHAGFESAPFSRLDGLTACGNTFSGSRDDFGALSLVRVWNATIARNTFTDNDVGLLTTSGQNVTLLNNTFASSATFGAYLSTSDTSRVQGNSFEGNKVGLRVPSWSQADARDNWWGHATGPSGEHDGMGDPVSGDHVLFDPWLTEAPAPAADFPSPEARC